MVEQSGGVEDQSGVGSQNVLCGWAEWLSRVEEVLKTYYVLEQSDWAEWLSDWALP